MSAWLEDAKRVAVTVIAAALGLTIGRDGKSFGPCPNCGELTRAGSGRRDVRGRCAVLGLGWHCYTNGSAGCEASGSGPGLVAFVLTGGPWHSGGTATASLVRDWFARHGWCEPAADARCASPPRRHVPSVLPEPPPLRPDRYEVAQVWFHAPAVTADPEAAAYLAGRGFDPEHVAELDLARALPADLSPAWARRGWRTWQESGHRLIFGLWEPDPTMPGLLRVASVHARCVGTCDDSEKASSPQGCSHRRLVLTAGDDFLADGRAQRLLTICEGPIDFLALALQPAAMRGALIGGISGSASGEILALVPTDWTVAVATHADGGGDQQAIAWKREIERRGCRYVRCRRQSAA